MSEEKSKTRRGPEAPRRLEDDIDDFFSLEKVVSYYSEHGLHGYESELFGMFLGCKGRVLDLCCGAGRVSIPLAKAGFDVTGIDINKKMIDTARAKAKSEKARARFVCADASKADLGKDRYDYVIVMENSFEQIPSASDRLAICRKVHRALRKGGIFINSFHSPFFPPNLLLRLAFHDFRIVIGNRKGDGPRKGYNDLSFKIRAYGRKLFFHFFLPSEIRSMLSEAGFKKSKVVPVRNLGRRGKVLRDGKVGRLFWPLLYQYWIAKK